MIIRDLSEGSFFGADERLIEKSIQDYRKTMITRLTNNFSKLNNSEFVAGYVNKVEGHNVRLVRMGDVSITVSIKNMECPALFNGQICLFSGSYCDNSFFADGIFFDCRQCIGKPIIPKKRTITVCSGPFINDSVKINSAKDLISNIDPLYPIYLGPFVHQNSKYAISRECIKPSDQLTESCMKELSNGKANSLFISSINDHYSLPFIPCQKIIDSSKDFITSGDPTLLDIEGLIILITTFNTLKTIKENQIYSANSDNEHLLSTTIYQNSLFPVYSHCIQYQNVLKCIPSIKPHIIISQDDDNHVFSFIESTISFTITPNTCAIIQLDNPLSRPEIRYF